MVLMVMHWRLVNFEGRYEDDVEVFMTTHLNWINGAAKKQHKLPPGACFWQQGSLIKGISTGPSERNCNFQVRTISIDIVLVTRPKPTLFYLHANQH